MIEDVAADTPCFLPVEIVDRAENDSNRSIGTACLSVAR
jgi:hypothetical protein